MTGRDASRREQAQAVFFSVVMVLSVVAIGAAGFAGSAAAQMADTAGQPDDLDVGQPSVTQDIVGAADSNFTSTSDNVTVVYDITELNNSEGANLSAALIDAGDVSVSSGSVVSAEFIVDPDSSNYGDYGSDDNIVALEINNTNSQFNITSAEVTGINTSGVSTNNGITYDYRLYNDQDPSDSGSENDGALSHFDLTAPDSITVTENNGNSIDYATDNVAEDGTVSVESGTYNESVSISTSNVTLEGPNAGVPGDEHTHNEAVVSADSGDGDTIDVVADDVTIDGLTIDTSRYGVFFADQSDSDGVTIQNNQIKGPGTGEFGYGVNTDGIASEETTAEIRDNHVSNFRIGIYVGGSSPESASAIIDGNVIEENERGVEFARGQEHQITANEIRDNDRGVVASDTIENLSEIEISQNNFGDHDGVAVDNNVSAKLEATNNWWGATNGPSGDFNGNGSAVTGSVSVDPATVSLDDGSVNLTQDFVGVVKDSQNVTLNDTSDATFSFDSESVPGELDGTLVLGINGTDYVFENVLDDGAINTSASGAEVDSGKNGTSIASTTPTGDTTITVVGNNSTTAVEDAGSVTLVHEAVGLSEGYNLKSVPQPAQLYTQDVDATNQWDPSENTYNSPSFSEGEDVDSGPDLHRGLYVDAASDDARLGYSFSTNEVPNPSDVVMGNGWHLVGSNFDISSESGTRNLDVDLRNVENVTTDGTPGVTAYGADQSTAIAGSSDINEYDTYWVYVDEGQTRLIIAPNYDPNGR